MLDDSVLCQIDGSTNVSMNALVRWCAFFLTELMTSDVIVGCGCDVQRPGQICFIVGLLMHSHFLTI